MLLAAQGTRRQRPIHLTCLGFSARCQGRGLARTFRRLGQESCRRNAKCVSQSRQGIGGHVLGTTLDPTDIGAVDIGGQRQSLLRQTSLNTKLAEIPPNDLADVHCPQESNMNGLTIDGPIVPYFVARGCTVLCMFGEMK